MKEVTDIFGKNAGKIWNSLNKYGPLPKLNLIKTTRLSENDFYTGVGWLARENKIAKVGTKYQLGDTNLTSKIGTDAGNVWNSLNYQGACDVPSLAKLTQIKLGDVYSALGWLAREEKIQIVEVGTKNKQLTLRVK